MKNENLLDIDGYKDIFKPINNQSLELSQSTCNHWYQFSKFIPNYLSLLNSFVTDVSISERINTIIEEELGAYDNNAHSALYEDAMSQIDLKVEKKNSWPVVKLEEDTKRVIERMADPEAFTAGVTFGLEIIAEENIEMLLKYSSPSLREEKLLRNTIFFRIHLVNEASHIKMCLENYKVICEQGRTRDFLKGYCLAKSFWKNFWGEVTT